MIRRVRGPLVIASPADLVIGILSIAISLGLGLFIGATWL